MNRSLVNSLLDCSEESQRLIILDAEDSNGRALLKFGVCQWSSRFDAVHVLLSEVSREHWVKGLPSEVISRLIIHDSTCAWMEQENVDICAFGLEGNVALVVDCISFLLLHYSPSRLCRWLLSISVQSHLLCLVHSDLHKESVLTDLQYIATSIVKLSRTTYSKGHIQSGVVHTTHRKPSGRIIKKTEAYSIHANYTSMDVCELSPIPETVPKSIDPAANLTFDLHLNDKEKADRARVILPYTSAMQAQNLEGVSCKGAGQIFYQPDEMEDSDPDEDLDF